MDLQVDTGLDIRARATCYELVQLQKQENFINAHECAYNYRLLSSASALFQLAIKP